MKKQIVVDIEVLDAKYCSENCDLIRYDIDDIEHCSLFGDIVGDEDGLIRTTECKENEVNNLHAQLEEKDKEIERRKLSFVCAYCGETGAAESPEKRMEMITNHMTVCLKHPVLILLERAEKAEAELATLHEKYYALIMAVSCKCPNETRHETALRYILERENSGKNSSAKMEINNDIS